MHEYPPQADLTLWLYKEGINAVCFLRPLSSIYILQMSASEDHLANLQELTRSERRAGFVERGNRLYQAPTIASPYPLPVDTPENEVRICYNFLILIR